MWWHTFTIPKFGRLRRELCYEFKDSLGYTSKFKASLWYRARPCLKHNNKKLHHEQVQSSHNECYHYVCLKCTKNFFLKNKVSQSLSGAQTGLECVTLVPQPPRCWDSGCGPPCPAYVGGQYSDGDQRKCVFYIFKNVNSHCFSIIHQ